MSLNIMSSSNFFFSFSFAVDNVQIVEPYPENIFAIEFSATQVTCVASDSSSGETTPEKIKFFRIDDFHRKHELTANNRLYFTNQTQNTWGESTMLRSLYLMFHLSL